MRQKSLIQSNSMYASKRRMTISERKEEAMRVRKNTLK